MLNAIILLTILGTCSGLLLALVAKKFAVVTDPRIEKVNEVLPGANCGGCGYAGCNAYAKAIVTDNAPINACNPGGQACIDKISAIMGVTATSQEATFAVVHCAGDNRLCQTRAQYRGSSSCRAMNLVYGGPKACTYGCLGAGDCAEVCPTGAIEISEHHLAYVIKDKCISCGKCLKACPRHLITLEKASSPYQVLCNSQDSPKQRHVYCEASCLGCKLCVKKAPEIFEMNGLVATAKALQDDQTKAEDAHIYCATGALVNIQETPADKWVNDLSLREQFKEKQAKVKAEAKAARLAALAAKESANATPNTSNASEAKND